MGAPLPYVASHAAARMNAAVLGGIALLALSFLMPGHFLPWVSFQSQLVAALGAALVCLGSAWHVHRKGRKIQLPGLALLSIATAVVPWLQLAAGQVSFLSDALLPSMYLAGLSLAIAAGTVWSGEERASLQAALLAGLLGAAALSVVIALVQWLNLGWSVVWMAELPPGERPFANLGQPNHLATLLVLGVVAVILLFETGRLGTTAACMLGALLGLGLVMTQSRTGWLSLGVLGLACVLPVTRGRPRRIGPKSVIAAGSLFIGAILAWEPLNDALLLSAPLSLEARLTPGTRPLIWQAMLDAAAQSPWFGWGWNQVTIAQQAAALGGPPIGEMVSNAHNIVLDLAIWGGIPLATVWLVVVSFGVVRAARNADDIGTWASVLAIVVVLIHALLEYPLDHTYFLLPLGLLWGLTIAPSARPIQLPAWLHGAAVVGLALATLKIGAEYLSIEQAHRAARLSAAGIGIDGPGTVEIPDATWLDAPREFIRFIGTPARPHMSGSELDWMRDVARRNAFPPALLRYALAAGLNGRADDAASTLRQLCSMHAPVRCDEARSAWSAAQASYPSLRDVPLPERR